MYYIKGTCDADRAAIRFVPRTLLPQSAFLHGPHDLLHGHTLEVALAGGRLLTEDVAPAGVLGHGLGCAEVNNIFLGGGFSGGLLAQQNRLACGVIANLRAQQFADGADGQIVGFASRRVGVEDGAGDFLPVGGGDVLARRDFLRPVHGDVGEVVAHLAGGRQDSGQAEGRARAAKKPPVKDAILFFMSFFFGGKGMPSPLRSAA